LLPRYTSRMPVVLLLTLPCPDDIMLGVDLNLLVALDALLAEGSVAGAARRLGLSSSAMSRTLTRLRSATGDPLLVRAGRGLAPPPPCRRATRTRSFADPRRTGRSTAGRQ
jgi:hypothetical protein